MEPREGDLLKLVLYSRAGCHLCEDAEAALAALGVSFVRVEVTGDADLEARYGWDVPVLVRDDETILKGVITKKRLRDKLGMGPA